MGILTLSAGTRRAVRLCCRLMSFAVGTMTRRWLIAVMLALSLRSVGLLGADRPSPLRPIIGKDSNGRLEIFAVNPQGELRHRWQKQTAGDWSSWSTIGTNLAPGFVVISGLDGRMTVFAVQVSDHAVVYAQQISTNSLDWSSWTSLGGAVTAPLAAKLNSRGGFDLFATGLKDHHLHHIWESESGSPWSGWQTISANLLPDFALAVAADGRFTIFGRDAASSNIVHSIEIPGESPSQWGPWQSLGQFAATDFVVGQNIRGVLEIFALDDEHRLFRTIQRNTDNIQSWSEWEPFGENLRTGIALGQSADGRLEVFAINRTNDVLLHRWETLATGVDQWSAWASMEHTARPFIAVGQNEDGNLEVFAIDLTNPSEINHRRQISKASGWLDWTSLDQPVFQYSSRTWQVDDGLPNNNVQAIAQSSDGFLWIGTHDGLAKFDGITFTSYNSFGPSVLQNASITALSSDSDGSLWIGTDGGGLFRLSGTNLFHVSTANGLSGNTVKVIQQTSDRSIWIGTTNGLSRFHEGQFKTYSSRDGLLSDSVNYLCEDGEHNLWIATGSGLNRLRDRSMDSFKMPNNLPNDSVRGICQDRGGRIWIGSNNGMLWYNAYWGKSFFAYNTRYGLSDSFVSAIHEDREGNLWVGTYSGLNRFREGRFFPELNNEGVPFDKVNTLFEDREGNLWVGSVEGLIRLTPKRFSTFTKKNGLSHNNVMAVHEDVAGGLWVTTWGGGINYLRDERVKIYAGTNAIPSDLILSTWESADGSIWFGADYDAGLLRYKNGKFTRFTSKDGLISGPIRVLREDPRQILWIGTARGLCSFKDGIFKTYTTRDGLPGNSVRALSTEPDGTLWIGTDTGLARLQNGEFKTFSSKEGLSHNSITAFHHDNRGSLWIGTAGGGLKRYNQGAFKSYTTDQGLFSDEIFQILEDDGDWLWMSSSHGIFRVSIAQLNQMDHGVESRIACVSYGITDGLESVHCNGMGKPAAWKTRDGRLLFATSKGFASVFPASATVNTSAPPVYIEQVFADKKPVLLAGPKIHRDNPGVDEEVEIKPGHGELEFVFTALSFAAPESNFFKYRLEGADTEWMDAGARRSARYNNVNPGTYRFRVMACNKNGVWNEAGASILFVLAPHIWETWWFRSLIVLVIITAVAGSARYITERKLRRKLELLQQRHAVERERGRIARDIHDDLGSSLTRILMLGERAEEGLASEEDVGGHVQKIVSSARHTVQSLDEIVWAVNPDNDSLEGLVEYISQFANEFFENTPVRCHLEIPVQLPRFTIAAEFRHDIFLIVKEAFNNILKHSNASRVSVGVSVVDNQLHILIEDDGKGFNSSRIGNDIPRGNGLVNMQKRAEALSGSFSLTAVAGKGVKIEIVANLTYLKTHD